MSLTPCCRSTCHSTTKKYLKFTNYAHTRCANCALACTVALPGGNRACALHGPVLVPAGKAGSQTCSCSLAFTTVAAHSHCDCCSPAFSVLIAPDLSGAVVPLQGLVLECPPSCAVLAACCVVLQQLRPKTIATVNLHCRKCGLTF